MKRILLLLTVTAVMALMVASAAQAQVWPPEEKAAPPPPPPAPQAMPETGGPALLPLGGAVAMGLGLSAGIVYLRHRR